MDCGWDGGQGGQITGRNTQKVGGYRGNTFIKPPAGGDGGLGGGKSGAARWLQITVVSAAAFSRWRSVERGTTGPGLPKHVGQLPHTHTLTRTRANARGHALQRRVKSRRLENESPRFSSSTRELTEGPQCCKKKEEEKEKKLLA